MKTKETEQLGFGFGTNRALLPASETESQNLREQELKVKSLITFSEIEKIIYWQIHKVEPKNTFDAQAAIGTAIDWFLVPANFIYRYRDNYCFPPELYPEWDLKTVFAKFFPTGWQFGNLLTLLENHRPNFFVGKKSPNLALGREHIKRQLVPLWQEAAKKFKLDALYVQSIMAQDGNFLLSEGRTASSETIAAIGQRIVSERFDTLIDDDKSYTYLAKPDCLLKFEVAGYDFNILVQPDYIKRLREERKTVQKRNIVVKRIVGDFKDSNMKDITDFEKPFSQVMLVYNWLLAQIGRNFKQNQLERIRLPNRQVRRVFLIPQEVAKPVPANQVQTALEFLQEGEGQIFTQMPPLTDELTEFAQSILVKALLLSRQPKLI